MSLDAATATELLKGLPPNEVEDIAMELARLDASGTRDRAEEVKVTREFYQSLQKKQSQRLSIRSFLNDILVSIVGKNRAEEIQERIRETTEKRDPFIPIRSTKTDELVLALDGEHPQTIAVVLSELTASKSQEVLRLLSDESRLKAISKMTSMETIGPEVKQRIASIVCERLMSFEGEVIPERREQTLRRLAIMIGGLEKEMRDQVLDNINEQDQETCTMIRNLMVTWEDIPSIADRSMQEAMRTVDSGKLAIALFGASEIIVQKIRSNISERAAAMLDEETSLMQEPLEKEVFDAREEVVQPLRAANEEGTLRRVGG